MMRIPISLTMIVAVVLAILGASSNSAPDKQDKYTLKSPSGIGFSDFRGYEDWAEVSSARTDEVLKVIVANPAMIDAFKAGIPANGSKIVKLQWKQKKSTEAPFVVDVPDVFSQAFVTLCGSSLKIPHCGDRLLGGNTIREVGLLEVTAAKLSVRNYEFNLSLTEGLKYWRRGCLRDVGVGDRKLAASRRTV
jgi:hypothetical protein